MKIKLDRIISIATLAAALIAIVLVLKKPAPVAQAPAPVAIPEHSSPVEQQTNTAQQAGQESRPSNTVESPKLEAGQASMPSSKPTAQINSGEISAALEKTLGSAAGTASLAADSNLGGGTPNIKDQQVTMEGDIVHGKFLTEVGGKDVWVTISGHMGEKDGYATFDPTEFKVGDMEVPVALVQSRAAEKTGRRARSSESVE